MADRAEIVARLRRAGCVYAEDEAALILAETSAPAEVERMVAARVAGAPLEHVLGWAQFAGRRIAVDPSVFVPRRRTELLVHLAVLNAPPNAVVVDLCCGTGAVGITIAARLDRPELYAVDIDPAAVRCARRNVGPLGTVLAGDLFAALPATLRGRIDILAVNAPYVPSAEIGLMPSEAREHEARIALDGGADGLDLHRRVVGEAAEWLTPAGRLLIEVAEVQVAAAAAIMAGAGLTSSVVRSADLDATAVVATRRS
ncbi:MAG TPA: putative protein N(5)-glutamine methyltransferase [Mycobacteriales bacterium]|nr:putative protein N(5)-glutamine methyltransferase [Mycobacteriales bacterium]